MLGDIPRVDDDRVLVDFRTGDDAGVYTWGSGPALVQTVDFFTPVVDDPYVYGQIAAANALSDVYAMGGDAEDGARNRRAAERRARRGRHQSDLSRRLRQASGSGDRAARRPHRHRSGDQVRLRDHRRNPTRPRAARTPRARAGDQLLLTKPLGTGIIATALKFNRAAERQVDGAIESMVRLNRDAARTLRALPAGVVSACTDVTGFGLAGHGAAMAAASGVTLVFETPSLPLLEGALGLAAANTPGGGRTNQQHFGPRVDHRAIGHRRDAAGGVRSPDVGGAAHCGRPVGDGACRSAGSRTPGSRPAWSGGSEAGQPARILVRVE